MSPAATPSTPIPPIFLLLLILIVAAVSSVAAAQKQTSLTVPPRDESSAGPGGVEPPNRRNYTGKSLASQFLYAHNKVRGGYDLPGLKWNRTLARFARRYARTRRADCQLKHSESRIYGENMFWSKYGHWTPANVVKSWADEGNFFDFDTNECTEEKQCGHFTQVIWKSTTQLGCARAQCYNDKGFIYVCAYDPPGNYYFQGPLGGLYQNSIV